MTGQVLLPLLSQNQTVLTCLLSSTYSRLSQELEPADPVKSL